MPTSPAATANSRGPEAALARLRQAGNPFTFSVATSGSERDCLSYDVAELCDTQRADLRTIIDLYRRPDEPTRLYPVIGDPGTGKTHLLTIFQAELAEAAEEAGSESLVVVADHFSAGLDAVDFFLWQIVNHLLAGRGPGARTLRVVADRLTARLLGEAFRRLSPRDQVRLIPPGSPWERLRLWLGSARPVEARLAAVRNLLTHCDSPAPSALAEACQAAGIRPERAWEEIDKHLERTEPKDAAGFLRHRLYGALARLALLGESAPIEEFLSEGYREEGPQHVKDAGQLGRRLLVALLEIFRALHIPVVLVFDQIEDFVVGQDEARQKELIGAFGRALAALVNHVPSLCLLVFAARGIWNRMLLNLDTYAKARIDQVFDLPGRPSRRAIEMPQRVPREHLERIVERRVLARLGDFDPTGLPPIFPFSEENLRQLEGEPTVRACLRRLADWFNEAVYGKPSRQGDEKDKTVPQPPPLLVILDARWRAEVASARELLEGDTPRPSLIPEVQTALERWLAYLHEQRLGCAAAWAKVELLQETAFGPYGYLTVIRPESPDMPGIGVAAWLAGTRGRPRDLECRLRFFDRKPCPIRSLVLFRADGRNALNGDTLAVYEKLAVGLGRDVRIQTYKQSHLEDVIAFPRWLQATCPEMEAAGEAGAPVLRDYAKKRSDELLGWAAKWLKPPGVEAS
jgi:hypothetical protein